MNSGINFNRPALLAAAQAARRRTLLAALGAGYVTLLGLLAAYLGVEGFLMRRALATAQASLRSERALRSQADDLLHVDPAFLELMHQVSGPDKCWVPRLGRLAQLLPQNAWIVRLDAGTSNATLGDSKRRRLAFNVSATTRSEEDKILFPVRFVHALQADSLFSAGYSDIHFSSTRVLAGTEAVVVNFDVECR